LIASGPKSAGADRYLSVIATSGNFARFDFTGRSLRSARANTVIIDLFARATLVFCSKIFSLQ
jgi:hypothetical protein